MILLKLNTHRSKSVPHWYTFGGSLCTVQV